MLSRKYGYVFLILAVSLLLMGMPSFFHDCSPGGPDTGSTDLAFENSDSDDIPMNHVIPQSLLMLDSFSGVSDLVDSWEVLSLFSFQGSHFAHPMLLLR